MHVEFQRLCRRRFLAQGAQLAAIAAGGAAGGLRSARAGRAQQQQLSRLRGKIFAECGNNVVRLLRGWLEQKLDPRTHLFSRGGVWDYHNEAADHYSSLVLIAHYVDPNLIEPGGILHRTLRSSIRLCSTPSGLPTTYDLRAEAQGRRASLVELSEWLRDGLIRILEVLGTDNDWYRELERLTEAVLAAAAKEGTLWQALRTDEARGNMLQTLARLYAVSGKESCLRAAEELADAVLLGPEQSQAPMVFSDHGCELVPGLGELIALECQLGNARAETYRKPLRYLLDSVLAGGADPVTGLFSQVKPRAGELVRLQPPDTWGYVLFAYENYDRATGEGRYTAAVERPLRWLIDHREHYPDFKDTLWPRSLSSDDWSDSYESMIVLWNRYREVGDGFAWLDWATRQHVHRSPMDRKYGPYTGGHFDGSAGRTLAMHMMLCSQGVRAAPFREGLELGGIQENGQLLLTVQAPDEWRGRLFFDGPRTEFPAGSIHWARINEMAQWFIVRPEKRYRVVVNYGPEAVVSGRNLLDGWRVDLSPGASRIICVAEQ